MATVLGWLSLLLPILVPVFRAVLPKLLPKLFAFLSKLMGGTGIIAAVLGFFASIVGWLRRFPTWLKGLFAAGGVLGFVSKFFLWIVNVFKFPILLGIALVTSSIFPTFVEKIFLVVGSVVLRLFLFIFKLGKNVFLGAMNTAGSGGGSALDEFRNSVLDSFEELPPCMVDIMGYLHLVEDLGLIVTTAAILALVSVFKIVYGGFFTKSGSPL